MAAPRRVKTPSAGPGFSPLPVKPIPETGSIVAVAVNSGAVSTHVLATDVSLVELIPDVDCYVAAGDTCSSADYPLKAGGYFPFGIPTPGTKLAFRAVTGAGSVKVVGA